MTEPSERSSKQTCVVIGCDREMFARRWCNGHYARWRRTGEVGTTPIGKSGGQFKERKPCAVDGCDQSANVHAGGGMCYRHYARWKRHGTTDKPLRKAAEARKHNGYVYLWRPDHPYANQGRYAEHRVKMEGKLGRLLQPEETVHHKNGQRDDNRLANLELWTTKHPKGQRIQDLRAFAEEILALYPE